MKIIYSIFLIAVLTFSPALSFVHAQNGLGNNPNDRGGLGTNPDDRGGLGNNPGRTGDTGSVALQNPLQSDSIIGLFQAILNVVTILAIPIIVFFIIYAGFMYVWARGKPDAIGTANKALLYAIIGGVIILGANLIMELIRATVESF